MPKLSKTKRIIKFYEQMLIFDLLMLDSFEDDNNDEEDDLLEELTLFLAILQNTRYLSPFIRHSVPKSHNFINNVIPLFDEERFRQFIRIPWYAFKFVHDLIKDDPIFNGPRSSQQLPSEVQLIIVLYRLG